LEDINGDVLQADFGTYPHRRRCTTPFAFPRRKIF